MTKRWRQNKKTKRQSRFRLLVTMNKFWQFWIQDNLCYQTIKSDTGQHSQFLRCLHIYIYAFQNITVYVDWICAYFALQGFLLVLAAIVIIDVLIFTAMHFSSYCSRISCWRHHSKGTLSLVTFSLWRFVFNPKTKKSFEGMYGIYSIIYKVMSSSSQSNKTPYCPGPGGIGNIALGPSGLGQYFSVLPSPLGLGNTIRIHYQYQSI